MRMSALGAQAKMRIIVRIGAYGRKARGMAGFLARSDVREAAMRAWVVAAALVAAAGGAQAQQFRSHYDWQSGNSYSIYSDPSGTRYNGMNLNNGSMWSGQIDRQGNQRGFDAQGNPWSYNSSTGTYMNYGTGKTCMGQGSLRTCY